MGRFGLSLSCGIFGALLLCVLCENEDFRAIADRSMILSDDFLDNKWKAVEPIHLDTSGWIPEPQTQDSLPPEPQRRRLRKRKRRPPMISLTNDEEDDRAYRRRRPQLEEQPTWEEMTKEARGTSYNRRRVTPSFIDGGFGDKEAKVSEDVMRDQIEKKEEEELDLRVLLKQAGSLSEILQRKNLTLSDLLKGEKKALYALTELPEVEAVTEYKNPVEESFKQEVDIITISPDIIKEVKVETSFDDSMKYEVVPQTSEKNSFSNVIVVDYKPKNLGDISNFQTTTSSEPPKAQTRNLPITSAKINKRLKTTTQKTDIQKPTPFQISITELLSSKTKTDDKTDENDGPLRMSIDLNQIPSTEKIPDKIKSITAKDEIFEVLQDRDAKENLTRILKSRNMTIADLVELRERGSSQRHLADLFHNKTREPEPKEEAYVGKFVHVPVVRIPKTHGQIIMKKPIIKEESSEVKAIEENKDKNKYTVTSFPTYKIEMDKKYKEVISEPIWRDFDKLYKATHQKGTVETVDGFEETQIIEEIDNSIAESGVEQLNVDLQDKFQDDEGNVFIKLPYGVKHAILASLLIIGISLFIFITILLIFKWSQKHKKRLCYSGSFNCSKIKPILDGGEKRTFRNFVSETLSRKKHVYKQHLQSMSDNWANDKKPFQ